ncbi:MAG: FixH family protein [Chitinophagales bacterium]
MNWGTGLAVTMVAFMILILSFVYRSTQQDFSLVSKDYYEEALDHDAVQLKRSNYKALNETVNVKINSADQQLEVALPDVFNNQPIEGIIYLYRPTDDKADVQYFMKDIQVSIPTQALIKGLWKIKVDWSVAGKAYLFEQSVFLN